MNKIGVRVQHKKSKKIFTFPWKFINGKVCYSTGKPVNLDLNNWVVLSTSH